jgi:hypothetical protein
MSDDTPVSLVTTRPEADVAADLKRRADEALAPLAALLDEAAANGLLIRWDAIAPSAPYFRHAVIGLRIEKHYK